MTIDKKFQAISGLSAGKQKKGGIAEKEWEKAEVKRMKG
jgi:hypothetical protein